MSTGRPRMTSREAASRLHIPTAIIQFNRVHGYAPTVKELSLLVDKSVGWTHAALLRLREDGYVEWESGIPRTLRVPGMTDMERLVAKG